MRRAPLLAALCAALLSGCAATAAAPPAVRTVDSHPPSAATIAMRWQWLNPEINSFTFRETKDVFAFRDVAAPQEAWTLARAEGFAMPRATVDGREASYDAWADRTFTNAMLVMRDGRIVFEDYRNRMTPATRHIGFSMTKTITAMLIGQALARGGRSCPRTGSRR